MRKVFLAGSCLLAASVAACATATNYGPAIDSRYGFSETQIEANRWNVSFSGNSLTDMKTVQTYLLYRAAELTSQNGYDYFIVVERETEEDTSLRSSGYGLRRTPFDLRYYSPGWGWRAGFDPFYDDLMLREVTRYEALAEIIMKKGFKPEDNEKAYNAEEVLINLAPNITRGEAN